MQFIPIACLSLLVLLASAKEPEQDFTPFPIIQMLSPQTVGDQPLDHVPPFTNPDNHFKDIAEGMAHHFVHFGPGPQEAPHVSFVIHHLPQSDQEMGHQEVHHIIGNDLRHGLHMFHPLGDHHHHQHLHRHHGHHPSAFPQGDDLPPGAFPATLAMNRSGPLAFLRKDSEDSKLRHQCMSDFQELCENEVPFDEEKPFGLFYLGFKCLDKKRDQVSEGCKHHLEETMFNQCNEDIEKLCDFRHPIVLTLKSNRDSLTENCQKFFDNQADTVPLHAHINEGLNQVIHNVLRTFHDLAQGLDMDVQNASDSDDSIIKSFSTMSTDADGLITSSSTMTIKMDDENDSMDDVAGISSEDSEDTDAVFIQSLQSSNDASVASISAAAKPHHEGLFQRYVVDHLSMVLLGSAMCILIIGLACFMKKGKGEKELEDPTGDKARYFATGP
mmetsp:Transcript_24216/g.27446  ORF Transcript_24216/g.27446 Transcript_24216/m.27446 type:complete len:442 (-) Transcript_24216:34-1359(-)